MPPRPKNIILDLLSTLRGGSAPVRLLIAAGELFAVEENSTRVALARLASSGLVERDERGAYRLGRAAEPVQGQVRSWRQIESRLGRWDGSWIAAAFAKPPRGREQRLQRRAVQFTGMQELAPGLWIRPANLVGGLTTTRDILLGLGMGQSVPLFRICDLDPTTQTRALGLWPIEAIRQGYREATDELAASSARLLSMEPAAAMAESFLVGGRAIRRIVLDPLLPEPMLAAAERRALLTAMNAYDLSGRALWARFMRGFGLATAAAPMDQRLGDRLVASATSASGAIP